MKNFLRILTTLLALSLLCTGMAFAEAPAQDPAGNDIALPAELNKVICLAPSTTIILDSLGLTDRLVAVDTYSPVYIESLSSLPQFDMMTPDIEQIAALEPDVVFTTGMSYVDGNPFAQLVDMGICVVDIPSSESIAEIQSDILFVASCFGMADEGQAIVDEMQATIDEITAIGATITEKKTVLFEISALPYIYSFGAGTFLNEMIEMIGAENILADQQSWVPVTEEFAVAANPDVILTSVDYLDDPVGEILSRTGWENVTAVANKAVYAIDNGYSSLPNQYVVKAMIQMAQAIYPEAYASLSAE